MSVAVDDSDFLSLNLPESQSVHTGSAVVDPTVVVYFPATQLVCSVQLSVAMDDGDVESWNLPESQAVHTGSAVVVPTVAVCFPAGQSV